jgi:hypothetical protein
LLALTCHGAISLSAALRNILRCNWLSELVDFITGPRNFSETGPKRLGFFISIDPGHWRFVDPIFSKRGLYKIVVQLSALNVEPDRLTLFVNWDGAKLVILSDADEILETAEVLSG